MIRKLGKESPPWMWWNAGAGQVTARVPNAEAFRPRRRHAETGRQGAAEPDRSEALNGQLDNFELPRGESYTDTARRNSPVGQWTNNGFILRFPSTKPAPVVYSDAKSRSAASWDLTAARAAAIARFYRDQTSLPFLNVLVIGRGDSEPIVPNTGEDHARNCRVEITVTPLPVSFHSSDPDKTASGTATDSPAPAPAPSAPAAKEKDKAKAKAADKAPAH